MSGTVHMCQEVGGEDLLATNLARIYDELLVGEIIFRIKLMLSVQAAMSIEPSKAGRSQATLSHH